MAEPSETDRSTTITMTGGEASSDEWTGRGGSVPVIAVIGDLDLTNADELRAAVDASLQRSTRLVVDMTALTFMDSSGLAVLIDAARRAESVTLRSVPPLVGRVIELTGVAGVFRIVP